MRKIMFLTVLLCLVAFVMSAYAGKKSKDVNVVNTMVYRFAGYSSERTDGNAGGPLGMHAICQGNFGPTARMCTTEEFWKSPGIVDAGGPLGAWIQPTIVAAYFNVLAADAVCMDFSGDLFLCDPNKSTCNQWKTAVDSFNGTTVRATTGETIVRSCLNGLFVACCTPASQTE